MGILGIWQRIEDCYVPDEVLGIFKNRIDVNFEIKQFIKRFMEIFQSNLNECDRKLTVRVEFLKDGLMENSYSFTKEFFFNFHD